MVSPRGRSKAMEWALILPYKSVRDPCRLSLWSVIFCSVVSDIWPALWTAVFDHELRNVKKFRLCRSRSFNIPGAHEGGLHQGIPAQECDQHRMRPQSLSDKSLHWPVSPHATEATNLYIIVIIGTLKPTPIQIWQLGLTTINKNGRRTHF